MFNINNKANALMQAMTEHEGWLNPAKSGTGKGSRSYRNHNPGNLRSSPFQAGTDDNFAFFENDNIGWFAFFWDLFQKSRGNTKTGLNGKSTLKQLIYVWAPPSDNNNTENYLAFVVKKSGLAPETTLAEIFKL